MLLSGDPVFAALPADVTLAGDADFTGWDLVASVLQGRAKRIVRFMPDIVM